MFKNFRNTPININKLSIRILFIVIILLGIPYVIGAYEASITVCQIILISLGFLLLFIDMIINIVFCRCHYCNSYIFHMDIYSKYCPYCSKSLDRTKKEVLDELEKNKKEMEKEIEDWYMKYH